MKLLQTRLMNQRRIPTASGILPPHIYNGSIDCFVQVYGLKYYVHMFCLF